MRLVRRRIFLFNSRPPTSSNACQMAGTTRRWLLANSSASAARAAPVAPPRAAAAGEVLHRTLGQARRLQVVELLFDRRPRYPAGAHQVVDGLRRLADQELDDSQARAADDHLRHRHDLALTVPHHRSPARPATRRIGGNRTLRPFRAPLTFIPPFMLAFGCVCGNPPFGGDVTGGSEKAEGEGGRKDKG